MRRWIVAALTTALAVGLVVPVQAAPPSPAAASGVPAEAPPAAHAAEPALPEPVGWPFGAAFPRTSGTGRHHDGALFWSDYLYDDHGAVGQGAKWYIGQYRTAGTYAYPGATPWLPGTGIGADNAADIFRVAVGLDDTATWWRVDWNTLLDPNHPIAAWGFASGDDTPAPWPAVSGLHAAGIERTLLVSSRGAWLVDADGTRRPAGEVLVDAEARSFVVRLPLTTFDPRSYARLYAVSGVADETGEGFAPVGPELGALPDQPPVYNVSFRGYEHERAAQQEPLGAKVRGLYSDKAQAAALAEGDVSRFGHDVEWSALADRRRDAEPLVRGVSNRWYVSSVELGQGVVNSYEGFSDGLPNLLGRVQPYTAYVPDSYEPGTPAPLTLLFHPNGSTHNEYVDSPVLLRLACEERGSICVTPAQRSPDMYFVDESQLDVWEVWNRAAAAFTLDPERTAVLAFSQGGGVANQVAMAHPDLFARVAVFSPGCCADTDQVENLRSVPFFVGDASADPTLPGALAQAERLQALGYRHRFELYPAADHVTFGYTDGYASGARHLGDGSERREQAPARVTYRWHEGGARRDLGFGPMGSYWLRDVTARDPATDGRVAGHSAALADPVVVPEVEHGVTGTGEEPVGVFRELRWRLGQAPPLRAHVELRVTNVGQVTLRASLAGLVEHRLATIAVTTDGPTTLRLTELAPGTRVTGPTGEMTVARNGTASVAIAAAGGMVRLAR